MKNERLTKFIAILVSKLSLGELEQVIAEVEDTTSVLSVNPKLMPYVEELVNKLTSSGLKCYNNMCNTEYEEVELVLFGDENVPMCKDCRFRNRALIA
jgi:hypothetical protein